MAATDRGPASYDAEQWTFPYPPVSSPGRITVALDGTVFAPGPNGMAARIWRFAAVTASHIGRIDTADGSGGRRRIA